MKNSVQTHRTLSRRPTGRSAVTQRVLSRIPTGHSAVKANGHSAVTHRTLSRQRTAEYPAKHGYIALIFQHRFNLSAQTEQVDSFKHRHAASCAALRRVLAQWLVSVQDNSKTKTKPVEATVYER